MKNENFITIQGWMVNELGLSGNDLICYALVYGFSQDEESEFAGSLSYVAGCLNITKQNARKVLLRLVEKGLITKRDEEVARGIKLCKYSAKVKRDTAVSKEQRGMSETATNNKEDNIEVGKEKKDKSFSKKDEFPTLAAECISPYAKPKKKSNELDLSIVESEEMLEVVKDWLEYKKERGESYKPRGFSAFYKKLKEYSGGDVSKAKEIVETSMANNWQGIFALKQSNQSNKKDEKEETEYIRGKFKIGNVVYQ